MDERRGRALVAAAIHFEALGLEYNLKREDDEPCYCNRTTVREMWDSISRYCLEKWGISVSEDEAEFVAKFIQQQLLSRVDDWMKIMCFNDTSTRNRNEVILLLMKRRFEWFQKLKSLGEIVGRETPSD